MASLPQKGVKGDNFKKWAIDSINKLIDYLSSPYLQNGKGIAIRRTPSGTIIELEKQPSTTPQSSGGSGGTQDISNTTGNNPSIGITGSTSSVGFVGNGNVTITGNTNGQIEFNVTGGGGSFYPVWQNLVSEDLSLVFDATYEHLTPIILQSSGYLYIQYFPEVNLDDNNSSAELRCSVSVDSKEVFYYLREISLGSYSHGDPLPITFSESLEHTSMIPVHSGSTVTALCSENNAQLLYLRLYKDTSA